MPVNTRHDSYTQYQDRWKRGRDCYEGSDAVKAARDEYLPMLSSHLKDVVGNRGKSASYDNYLMRALFYNAVTRTVDGFSGAIFQREPEFTVTKTMKDADLKDITRTGVSCEMFSLKATRQILTTGRYGILVEMPETPKPGIVDRFFGRAPAVTPRPYWVGFHAEDIVNWDTARVNGETVLAWIVLREFVPVRNPKDMFTATMVEQYRVLELEEGGCTVTVWRPDPEKKDEWREGPHVPIQRRGKGLEFVPFTCIGPTTVSIDVERPPLIDLIDVNLSHYRTMADLEHGRHFCALPQPWVKGVPKPDDGPLSIGSSKAWMLGDNGSAGMLEFTGQGLGALEKADEQKRRMMATLGARLLEEQPGTQETAAAVGMRHSGEHATLRTVAAAIEQGVTMALQVSSWWQGVGADPRQEKALCELNKDFFAVRMQPTELQALVAALQDEAISFETFYAALQRGEYARPGITAEEEQEQIRKEAEMRPEPEPVPVPGMPPAGGPPPPTPAKPPVPRGR
jgi:hypothetical protein